MKPKWNPLEELERLIKQKKDKGRQQPGSCGQRVASAVIVAQQTRVQKLRQHRTDVQWETGKSRSEGYHTEVGGVRQRTGLVRDFSRDYHHSPASARYYRSHTVSCTGPSCRHSSGSYPCSLCPAPNVHDRLGTRPFLPRSTSHNSNQFQLFTSKYARADKYATESEDAWRHLHKRVDRRHRPKKEETSPSKRRSSSEKMNADLFRVSRIGPSIKSRRVVTLTSSTAAVKLSDSGETIPEAEHDEAGGEEEQADDDDDKEQYEQERRLQRMHNKEGGWLGTGDSVGRTSTASLDERTTLPEMADLEDISDDDDLHDTSSLASGPGGWRGGNKQEVAADWGSLISSGERKEEEKKGQWSARERFAPHNWLRSCPLSTKHLHPTLVATIEQICNSKRDNDSMSDFKYLSDYGLAHVALAENEKAMERPFEVMDSNGPKALSARQDLRIRRRLCSYGPQLSDPSVVADRGLAFVPSLFNKSKALLLCGHN